jgi:hypothetical protein
MAESVDLDTGQIRQWRSILTLIVFVITSSCTVHQALPLCDY